MAAAEPFLRQEIFDCAANLHDQKIGLPAALAFSNACREITGKPAPFVDDMLSCEVAPGVRIEVTDGDDFEWADVEIDFELIDPALLDQIVSEVGLHREYRKVPLQTGQSRNLSSDKTEATLHDHLSPDGLLEASATYVGTSRKTLQMSELELEIAYETSPRPGRCVPDLSTSAAIDDVTDVHELYKLVGRRVSAADLLELQKRFANEVGYLPWTIVTKPIEDGTGDTTVMRLRTHSGDDQRDWMGVEERSLEDLESAFGVTRYRGPEWGPPSYELIGDVPGTTDTLVATFDFGEETDWANAVIIEPGPPSQRAVVRNSEDGPFRWRSNHCGAGDCSGDQGTYCFADGAQFVGEFSESGHPERGTYFAADGSLIRNELDVAAVASDPSPCGVAEVAIAGEEAVAQAARQRDADAAALLEQQEAARLAQLTTAFQKPLHWHRAEGSTGMQALSSGNPFLVEFSPSGSHLVVTTAEGRDHDSTDGDVRSWNVATGDLFEFSLRAEALHFAHHAPWLSVFERGRYASSSNTTIAVNYETGERSEQSGPRYGWDTRGRPVHDVQSHFSSGTAQQPAAKRGRGRTERPSSRKSPVIRTESAWVASNSSGQIWAGGDDTLHGSRLEGGDAVVLDITSRYVTRSAGGRQLVTAQWLVDMTTGVSQPLNEALSPHMILPGETELLVRTETGIAIHSAADQSLLRTLEGDFGECGYAGGLLALRSVLTEWRPEDYATCVWHQETQRLAVVHRSGIRLFNTLNGALVASLGDPRLSEEVRAAALAAWNAPEAVARRKAEAAADAAAYEHLEASSVAAMPQALSNVVESMDGLLPRFRAAMVAGSRSMGGAEGQLAATSAFSRYALSFSVFDTRIGELHDLTHGLTRCADVDGEFEALLKTSGDVRGANSGLEAAMTRVAGESTPAVWQYVLSNYANANFIMVDPTESVRQLQSVVRLISSSGCAR